MIREILCLAVTNNTSHRHSKSSSYKSYKGLLYLSRTTRSVAVSALLLRILSKFWIFCSSSDGSHFPFRMEAVRPRTRGLPEHPSNSCIQRERERVSTTTILSMLSTPTKTQPHLHYLTVGVVSDGQVTIIKNHQVDFRQL